MKRIIIIAALIFIAGISFAQSPITVTKARIINDNGGTKTIGYTITNSGTKAIKVVSQDFFLYEGKHDPDSANEVVDNALYRNHSETSGWSINGKSSQDASFVTSNIKVDPYTNAHDPELKKHIKNHLYFYGKLYYIDPSTGKKMAHRFKIKLQKTDQLTHKIVN